MTIALGGGLLLGLVASACLASRPLRAELAAAADHAREVGADLMERATTRPPGDGNSVVLDDEAVEPPAAVATL